MTNSIYLTTTEPYVGKSLVSLGITAMLLRNIPGGRIGVFRPVINEAADGKRDKNINLLLSHFKLDIDYEETYAFTKREVTEVLAKGNSNDLVDRVIKKYKALEAKTDFVVCIGSDFVGVDAAYEFDLNAEIAHNLGTPILILTNGANRDPETIASSAVVAIDSFREHDCHILGVIVNRADKSRLEDIREAVRARLDDSDYCVAVIPTNKTLGSPTVEEIKDALNADVLYGWNQLRNKVYHYRVIAMQLEHYLPYLQENALLITPGDRGDVILSALQASQSLNYPSIAGILLTGGLKPAESLRKLLDGLPSLPPILSTPTDTFTTATQVEPIRAYITPDNQGKIELSLRMFEKYVNTDRLGELISATHPTGMSPRMFIYNLQQKARANKKHIVLPEGTELRILKAVEILLFQEVVDVTLLGNPHEIKQIIQNEGLRIDLDQINIVEPCSAPQFDEYADTLYELRKHKGITRELVHDLMCDVSYFGTMMVYKGVADGMVSGAVHTTLHTIRPALQFIKTKPGFSVVSSVFFMALEDRVLVYGDCAVNPDPNAQELAEIAIASADTAQAFGIEPKVAMLSYSSGDSGKGAEVEKVREATRIVKERRPDLLVEGPIQYDAAVDPNVAKTKLPNSKVAGQATVFIFPDLNTGNNTYKAVQRETGAIAIGPVLQGLNKPVNDLSRGCTVEDIVNTVVITAIQAQME